MSADLHGLGALDAERAALTLPDWRWLAGMRWHVRRAPPLDDIAGYLVHPLPPGSHPYPGALPDLRDPATVGCLLALVREAWGDPEARTVALVKPGRWRCVVHEKLGLSHHRWFDADAEPAALVAALLAAPTR